MQLFGKDHVVDSDLIWNTEWKLGTRQYANAVRKQIECIWEILEHCLCSLFTLKILNFL
jgi:hypothetical protein